MHILEIACLGAKPDGNDDITGHLGDQQRGAAWVLDGATGIHDHELIRGHSSDAAWFAQSLHQQFLQHSLQGAVPDVMRQSLASIEEEFNRHIGSVVLPNYARPCASGVWLRWQQHQLVAVIIGDCHLFVRRANGVVERIGQEPSEEGDATLNQQIAKLQAAGIEDAVQLRAAVMDGLRASRARMNSKASKAVFSADLGLLPHLQPIEFTVASGDEVLLCSDGLYRWVDTYHQHDMAGFVEAIHQAGVMAVAAPLRALEQRDAQCRQYPRLKDKDDASAIRLGVARLP